MRRLIALNDRFWPIITLALAAAVTLLTLTPLPELDLPGPLARDKFQHFVAYGAIAFPVALARPRFWPLLLLAIVGWGAVIEFIQPHLGRHGALLDAIANTAGVVASVIGAAVIRRIVDILSPEGEPVRSR